MGRLKTLPPRLQPLKDRVPLAPAGSWRAGTGSSTARGYDYRWQQARLDHLRMHPLCVYCDQAGRVEAATIVDHVVPHRGDQALFWDRSNWQSLCAACHSSRKQREEHAHGY